MSQHRYCPKSPRGVDPPHCLHDREDADAARRGSTIKVCCWCGIGVDGGRILQHGPHLPAKPQGEVAP